MERANRTALTILGPSIIGASLGDVISSESISELAPPRPRRNATVSVRTVFERQQAMLATMHISDDLFGRWILQLNDPDDQQIMAGLQYAKATVEEVAAKARGPLMLARALIGRAINEVKTGQFSSTVADQLARAADSLGKADISYERLSGALGGKDQASLSGLFDAVRASLSPELVVRLEIFAPVNDAQIRTSLGDATRTLCQLVNWAAGSSNEGQVRITSSVHDDRVTLGLEGVEQRAGARVTIDEVDPVPVIERLARDAVNGSPSAFDNAHAAAIAEGWSLREGETGLEVDIPRVSADSKPLGVSYA